MIVKNDITIARKYHNSASLIDHIFPNKTNNLISVGVLEDSDLSDHFDTAYTEDLQILENNSGIFTFFRVGYFSK